MTIDQDAVQELAAAMAANPVQVTIKNWNDNPAKPSAIARTTLQTMIVDPGKGLGPSFAQICDLEPRRARLAIQSIDAPISVHLAQPNTSPDASGVTGVLAQPGRYIPNSLSYEFCFYGPDALWINTLGAFTRVTITKEYYASTAVSIR